jgi:putative PIN family toxin of toxin-antitoxin system
VKRVVIDTNVLVSSAITAGGNPDEILNSISDKLLQLYYSQEILDEYKRVLAYKKLNISIDTQESIIDSIEELGVLIDPQKSCITFADESDRTFYDTAKECGATLITGNIRHYPTNPLIMTPADFLGKSEHE